MCIYIHTYAHIHIYMHVCVFMHVYYPVAAFELARQVVHHHDFLGEGEVNKIIKDYVIKSFVDSLDEHEVDKLAGLVEFKKQTLLASLDEGMYLELKINKEGRISDIKKINRNVAWIGSKRGRPFRASPY